MPSTTSQKVLFTPLPNQDSESNDSEGGIVMPDIPCRDYSHEVNTFPPIHVFEHDTTFLNRIQNSFVSGQSVADLQSMYHKELAAPVGCRLAHFWPRWQALGASSYHLAKIRFGITLHWLDGPPPLVRFPLVKSDTQSIVQAEKISDAIQTMLSKRAIVQVSPDTPGFYSRIFMIPKKGTSKWRPVIDLSALNKYLIVPKFKMETAELIRASLQRREWVTSIDLQDAYFHAPLHRKFTKYFRFAFQNKVYEFQADPFGLAIAPLEFTNVAKEFKSIALGLGFRLNQYLDDWIDRCLSYSQGRMNIIKLLHVLLYLGFLPNFEKCSLDPSQEFDYLGMHYMLAAGLIRPTDKRSAQLVKVTESFIHSDFKTARQFMSLIGLLNATFSQVQQVGRLHIRPLQWQLRRWWQQTLSHENSGSQKSYLSSPLVGM